MNKQAIRDWVFALRSGYYKNQAIESFKNGDSFCVTGVFLDLNKFEWPKNESKITIETLELYGMRDKATKVMTSTGLTIEEIDFLAGRNNHGSSFSTIADYIEAKYLPEDIEARNKVSSEYVGFRILYGNNVYSFNPYRQMTTPHRPKNRLRTGVFVTVLLPLWAVGPLSSSDAMYEKEPRPYRAKYGMASWYSMEACRYNPNPACPTASGHSLYKLESSHVPFIAYNNAALGSKVKVTNLRNGAKVVAIVLDRGNYGKYGRIVDVSKGVAETLDFVASGTARVKVEVL